MTDSSSRTAPPAGRRRWRLRLALLLGSSLLALTLAELAFRMRFGTPMAERLPVVRIEANAYRGWQMVPGEEHYTYRHRVRINSLGMRGPEVEPRRPGEVRVLALGDSLTYGQGVADEETLPARLEQALERDDPTGRAWTVFNSGHRAYGTNQELGVLEEHGERLDLDLVVLLWFWNDLTSRDIEEIHARLAASGPIAQDVNAPMEGWTRVKWHLVQLARRSALVMRLHDLWRAGEPYPYEAVARTGLRRLERELDRMVELCARHGCQGVVAVLPDERHVLGDHPTVEMAERAGELARERGLPVVPLLPPLREHLEHTGRVPVLPYDGHYDAEGNRLMAEHLAAFLLAEGLPAEAAR